MNAQALLTEPGRVNEPHVAQEFSDVLSQVAANGQPVIFCRNGADFAAVVSLEHLELHRETVARQEVEIRAAQIEWNRVRKADRPPQQWFDDTDNPFEAEEEL